MLSQQLDTAIIDFDGTIADSTESIIDTVRQTMKTYDVTISKGDEQSIKNMIGLPLKDTIKKMSEGRIINIDEAINKYRELFNVNALNIELYPNVKNTLHYLHDNDVKLAVASGKGKNALNGLLKKLDIYEIFDCIISEQDVPYKKPSPDIINKILNLMNSKPDKSLVIGDTTYDIEMGNNALCKTCAVTYGAHLKDKLMKATPSYIVDDFKSIRDIFDNVY